MYSRHCRTCWEACTHALIVWGRRTRSYRWKRERYDALAEARVEVVPDCALFCRYGAAGRAAALIAASRRLRRNAMHLMYFTEQPMSAYPADIGLEFGHTALMFSNKYFDPVAGSRLYNEYLEHYIYAEEMGVEGFMLNEHHNAPFCMQAKCNIFASILAAVTKKAKIVLLGNPLPLAENPVRLAEELAMIDMISKGRLVSGFVRGGGQEQLATGVNPAFNRERFEEAHDLVVAAWTRQGPFRWEGHATSTASSTRGRCRCRSPTRGSGSRRISPKRSSGRPSSAIPISPEHLDRGHEAHLADL